MLTEKEAWLKIAEWFETGQRDVREANCLVVYVDMPEEPRSKVCLTGMCFAARQLLMSNFIDDTVYNKLVDTIDFHNPRGGYLFEENAEGDKQRVQFCKEQAAKLG